MKLRMLDALLVIKKESAFWKKCCKDFTVTLKMLGLCNKKQIYDNVNTAEENASENLESYHIDESDGLRYLSCIWLCMLCICMLNHR